VRAQLRAPAFEIAEYAKAESIDLLVIGTHGQGMLGHLLMGNVAEKVVRIAPCPVLTVPHPEHEFTQPDALKAAGAIGKRSAGRTPNTFGSGWASNDVSMKTF
jgi:hypothetical protein